jgi:hypothetical protein
MTRVLKSKSFDGGPVTAIVRLLKPDHALGIDDPELRRRSTTMPKGQ